MTKSSNSWKRVCRSDLTNRKCCNQIVNAWFCGDYCWSIWNWVRFRKRKEEEEESCCERRHQHAVSYCTSYPQNYWIGEKKATWNATTAKTITLNTLNSPCRVQDNSNKNKFKKSLTNFSFRFTKVIEKHFFRVQNILNEVCSAHEIF